MTHPRLRFWPSDFPPTETAPDFAPIDVTSLTEFAWPNGLRWTAHANGFFAFDGSACCWMREGTSVETQFPVSVS